MGSESIERATVPIAAPADVRADSSRVRALVLILTKAESAAATVSTTTVSALPRAVTIIGCLDWLTSHTGVSLTVADTPFESTPKSPNGSGVLALTCGETPGPVFNCDVTATESVANASIISSESTHAVHNTPSPTMKATGRITPTHPLFKAPAPASRTLARLRGLRALPGSRPGAARPRPPVPGRPPLRAPLQSRTRNGTPWSTPKR